MAPTAQPTLTREQQQALAKARARARISTGAGLGPTNPMVAQGQAAQREYADAGSPALPKPKPAPAPRVDLRNVNRAPQTQGPGYAEAKGSEIVGSDLQKGLRTIPQRIGNAAIGAVESAVNLPADLINSSRQANAAYKPDTANALRNVNRMPQMQETVGVQKPEAPQVPTVQAPRIPIADQDQSVSGQLLEGLAQFVLARGAIGKAAKGGGIASQLGKDIATTGVAFQGNTGRVSDMIDPNSMPAGPMRDYAAWLKTQPEDSPIMGRLKNMLEDLTLSGPALAPQAAVRGVQAVGNALSPSPVRPAAAAASPSPTAAVPAPSAPVAQAGSAGAGQQPSPGPAVAPAVVAGGQGGGVLNATPTAVGQSPLALAKSDAKIIGRLLRAGGVARNDVDHLLTGLVQAYQGGNSSRLPLAFFAEEYLPTVLPKQTADDVIQKLRGYGRTAFSSNEPGNASRAVMRDTIDTLRGSQRDVLTSDFENILGKETLLNKKGKIKRDKSDVAEAVYAEELARQQRMLDDGKATPEQVAARDDLLMLMGREDYFAEVPKELKIQALDEGKSSLWEFIHQNPLEAAHWMQSRMGELASKGNSIANTMRWPLVRRLEDAVGGYRGARLDYGDLFGQEKQIKFGDDLFAVAGNKLKTDEKALEFKKLSTAQKGVARKSIRDKLVNEFRKAKAGDDRAAVITAMQKDGVLDALETILGPDGKKVADGIRSMVKENDRLRAVDNLSGSNTADNLAQMQAAEDAVRSPVNKVVGSTLDKRSFGGTVFADAVLMGVGMPPIATASKIATGVVGKFGKPSAKKLAGATRTLYGLPTETSGNALATAIGSAPTAPRPAGGPKPKAPASQADLDKLLKQYDAKPTPALRNKIIAARKALAKSQPANALASPSRPPVKMGFGGGSSKGLRAAAIRYKGKVFSAETHDKALLDAEAAGVPIGKERIEEGFIGSNGKFVDRSDPNAALDALSAGQIADPTFRRMIEDKIRRGEAVSLVSDQVKLGSSKSLPMDEAGRGKSLLQQLARPNEPQRVADLLSGSPISVTREEAKEMLDLIRMHLRPKDPYEYGKGFGFTLDELKADPSIAEEFLDFDPQKLAQFQAVLGTITSPSQSGSSKLLAGMGASPEAVGGIGGGVAGYFGAQDTNDDGVVDASERAAQGLGGLASGIALAKGGRAVGNALKNATAPKLPPPLDLSPNNRIFSPGKPDDLGFITSAEYVLATPPARFKDAKALTPEQWRKFMREGGASSEAFQFQIEPALKRLADEGYTGDIPKAKLEEALARTRGTLSKPPETRAVERSAGSTTGRPGTTFDAPTERQYGEYVAPGKSSNYQQHVLLLPKEQGAGYKSHNWRSENPVGHIRTTNRTSANGEKVLHVEELQSDLHQEGAKSGYRGDMTPEQRATYEARSKDDLNNAYSLYRTWQSSADIRGVYGLPKPTNIDEALVNKIKDPEGRELYRNLVAAEKRYYAASRGAFRGDEGLPPKAPMENWEEPFIRYALKQGADQGVDLITFPKWDTLHRALKNDGTQKFYDDRLPRHLESVAKSLGLKVEMTRVPVNRVKSQIANELENSQDALAAAEWRNRMVDGQSPMSRKGQIAALRKEVEGLKRELADLNAGGVELPAIRLTPEAKARLSEGVIMDAKDPGRRAPPKPANAMKPARAGLGGPPKPQANALKGPPKKQGPLLSRAAEEATRELKAARSAYNRAANKWVMKDDRELRVKPLEERVVAAEAKLAQVLKNDARLKTLAARGRSVIESPNVNKPIAYGIGGAAIGASAIGAYNALKPQERGERPMSPKDPAFYWSTVTADKDKMVPVQLALKEWGEWPDDTEATGINGKVTKAAIRSWRYDRGLDPDAPMTKADTARLLAGPRGFQDRGGKTWRYGTDGAPVSPP